MHLYINAGRERLSYICHITQYSGNATFLTHCQLFGYIDKSRCFGRLPLNFIIQRYIQATGKANPICIANLFVNFPFFQYIVHAGRNAKCGGMLVIRRVIFPVYRNGFENTLFNIIRYFHYNDVLMLFQYCYVSANPRPL